MAVADNPARLREVADAIALELNATLAVTNESDGSPIVPARFTAAQIDGVDYKNEDLKTLHVDVRWTEWVLGPESRGGSNGVGTGGQDQYQLEITVQQAVLATDKAAINLLMDFVARIARYFCPTKRLRAYGNVLADQVEVIGTFTQLKNPDKLKQGRYFGLVTLTLQEFVNR